MVGVVGTSYLNGELVVDNGARRATVEGAEVLSWTGDIRTFRFGRDAATSSGLAVSFVGTGTDVWQIPTGVHMELEELVASGLSPMDAIRAATINSARIVGAERDLGSLAVGKLADLLVLEKNPLDDIRNTESLRWVMKAGRLWEADTLDEIWPEKKAFGGFPW